MFTPVWKDVLEHNQENGKVVLCLMMEMDSNGNDAVYVTQYIDGTWEVDVFRVGSEHYRRVTPITPANVEEAKALAIALYRME